MKYQAQVYEVDNSHSEGLASQKVRILVQAMP